MPRSSPRDKLHKRSLASPLRNKSPNEKRRTSRSRCRRSRSSYSARRRCSRSSTGRRMSSPRVRRAVQCRYGSGTFRGSVTDLDADDMKHVIEFLTKLAVDEDKPKDELFGKIRNSVTALEKYALELKEEPTSSDADAMKHVIEFLTKLVRMAYDEDETDVANLDEIMTSVFALKHYSGLVYPPTSPEEINLISSDPSDKRPPGTGSRTMPLKEYENKRKQDGSIELYGVTYWPVTDEGKTMFDQGYPFETVKRMGTPLKIVEPKLDFSGVHVIDWSEKGTVNVQLFGDYENEKIEALRLKMEELLNGSASQIEDSSDSGGPPPSFKIRVDESVDVATTIEASLRFLEKSKWRKGLQSQNSTWQQNVTVVNNFGRKHSQAHTTFQDLMNSIFEPVWAYREDVDANGRPKIKKHVVAKFTDMNNNTLAVFRNSEPSLETQSLWKYYPGFEPRAMRKRMKIVWFELETD